MISKFKTVCLHFIINLGVVVVEKAPVIFHPSFFYRITEKDNIKIICQINFSIVDLFYKFKLVIHSQSHH